MQQTKVAGSRAQEVMYETNSVEIAMAADPVYEYMTKDQLQKTFKKIKSDMEAAAKKLDFIEAARLRDEMFVLENKLKIFE
jgi:excinuclease ABC subunit B